MRLSWKVVENSTGGPIAVGSRYVEQLGPLPSEAELRRIFDEMGPALLSAMFDALVMVGRRSVPYHPAVVIELDSDLTLGDRPS